MTDRIYTYGTAFAVHKILCAVLARIFHESLAATTDVADIAEIVFGESRGRQAMTVTFTDDTIVEPVRTDSVDVINCDEAVLGGLYDFADERLIKAGWNWNLINNDESLGVHNFFGNGLFHSFGTAVAD